MGEEEKKPEEKKSEEPKPAEKEEKKKEESEEPKKPADSNNNSDDTKKEEKKEGTEEAKTKEEKPPQEIVLRVYMHCEGCARKVRRCLKGFPGVEDVMTDCKTSKVVVKGEKADPIKVTERVQRKSHRQVELISPIPKPPSEEEKKPEEEKEKPKPEEKKEQPPIVTVVLKVYMHCEACSQEIKKRILRMKGVESAEPDLKSSIVTVKGGFDPQKLVEYVHKRTGKQAVIVKQDSDAKKDDMAGEEKKKDDVAAEEKKKGGDEGGGDGKKGGGDVAASNNPEEKEKKKGDENSEQKTNGDVENNNKEGEVVTEESKVVEFKRNEFNYYPPRFAMELYAYNTYPPQIFSDENPNACSIM